MRTVETEKSIRQIVRSSVEAYANGFEARHVAEVNNPNGTINMKIHNVFIAALGEEIQYYTALVRSLDSSLGNMLEKVAINIAKLFYYLNHLQFLTLLNDAYLFVYHINNNHLHEF